MRRSPLFSGIIYVVLGIIFTLLAIQYVNSDGGWSFFSILLVILATFDFGSGLRMIKIHFILKKQKNEP
ncbi:YdiK family protein [Niallia sp. Krafla_26]|uniref:YdiK family protein n=1 Tax=Niallia sp. Krafla_26 TaxID=3064703 RepID=UPI003D17F9EE